MVKSLPAVQETWVQSPGREDTLEKEMATHSNSLAWSIPWTEEPGRLQSMGSHDCAVFTFMMSGLSEERSDIWIPERKIPWRLKP